MPIFEYHCDKCGNEFEQLILKNSPEPECPACHSQDLTKLLSLNSVSSPKSKIRAYYDNEKRDRKVRQEKSQAESHDHDHHHDH